MFSRTRTALEQFDNQHDFERMAADILNALGFTDVLPIAPRGGSDGGKDITFTTESGGKGLACVTLRKDSDKKFNEDFSQQKKESFEKYIFFTNQYLKADQKKRYIRYCLDDLDAQLVICDIEALRSLLDSMLKPIRETYLHIKDDSKGVSDKELEALREEMQRQHEADKLLLEADKFASNLREKEALIQKAIQLYPPYKQRELRQLGIETSIIVINGYDPATQRGLVTASLGRGMPGYGRLKRDEIAQLADRAINHLQENVVQATAPDAEGLLYLACMYGYQQQFENMMKVIDKAVQTDEGIKESFRQRKILLTLLRACSSDVGQLQKLRKKLGLGRVFKKDFCTFIQDFDPDFQGYIQWIAVKRPRVAGEKGVFLIHISPPYEANKGKVSASALSVESWQSEHFANGELMSVSELYNTLHTLFTLLCTTE